MSSDRRLVLWLALLFAGCLIFYLLSGMLTPFLAGLAIGYLLDPLADRLERIGLPRWLAASTIILAFFFVVVGVLLVVVPALQVQLAALATNLPDYLGTIDNHVQPLLARLRAELTPQQIEQLRGNVTGKAGDLVSWLSDMAGGLISGGLAIVSAVSLLVITPIVAFYLLRDWDRIVAIVDDLLPREHAETIREQFREIDKRLSGFVRGQAMVCVALGTYYGGGLTLIGLNHGLLIGFIAGLISFIPYLGTIVGFGLSVGVALFQYDEWTSIAIVVAVFVSGQMIEGNVLTPLLVGDRIGLHPVWVMFAILAGGAVLGFTGVLIAVPAAAVIGVLVRFLIDRYRRSQLYDASSPDGTGSE